MSSVHPKQSIPPMESTISVALSTDLLSAMSDEMSNGADSGSSDSSMSKQPLSPLHSASNPSASTFSSSSTSTSFSTATSSSVSASAQQAAAAAKLSPSGSIAQGQLSSSNLGSSSRASVSSINSIGLLASPPSSSSHSASILPHPHHANHAHHSAMYKSLPLPVITSSCGLEAILLSNNAPLWKISFWKQATARNQMQNEWFSALVEAQEKSVEKCNDLSHKLAVSNRENANLNQELQNLKHQLAMAKGHGEMSSQLASRDRMTILEEKLLKTQEELTESYKVKGQNAQLLLDLNQAMKVKDDELRVLHSETNSLQSKLSDREKTIADMTAKLKMTLEMEQVLKDELQALQLELLVKDEKLKNVVAENDALLERFLRKAAEEAKRMNEVNELYSSFAQQARAQALQEAANQNLGIAQSLEEEIITKGRTYSTVVLVPTGLIQKMAAHESEVNDVSYSNSGQLFLTCGSDKKIKVWDSSSLKTTVTLSGPTQGIMCATFNYKDDLIAAGSNDNTINVWGFPAGRHRHTLTGHIGKVHSIRFTGDSTRLLSGSHDRTIKLYDLTKGFCIRTIFSFSSCNDIVLADDSGNAVISGHVDNSIRFWDSRTGDCTNEMPGLHSGQVTSLDITADYRTLVTNSRDNTLRIVDVRMLQVVSTLSDSSYQCGMNWAKATFSPDGKYVCAGSADGSIKVWNTQTDKLEKTLKDLSSAVAAVAWSPRGSQVLSCDKDKMVCVWG